MKCVTFFKIGILCFTVLFLSCEKDDIKVSNTEYVSGGIGTSQTTGAIEFNFRIPTSYVTGRVSIEMQDLNSVKEVRGTGNKQIKFLNVASGIYDYTLEFWSTESDNNVGGTSAGAPLSKFYTITETVKIKNGKTLKIEVDLD